MRTAPPSLLRVRLDVAAAPERVWAEATDWARQDRWIPLTRAHVVSDIGDADIGDADIGDADGVGTRVDAWTGIGPVGFHDLMVVREWAPPHRLVLDHVGRVVRGQAGFDLVAIASGVTRIDWWERIDVPFGAVGRLGYRAAQPLLTATFRHSLRRLAALAERGAVHDA